MHNGRGSTKSGQVHPRTTRPDFIGIRASMSIQRGTASDRALERGEAVKRLKGTPGVMVAIAFVAPLTAGSHSGEVGKDGCHAGGGRHHCHFRMSKGSWIRPDPPGTPIRKIRKAGWEPERHRGMPAGHSPNVLEGTATVIDGDTIEIAGNRIRLHGIDAPEGKQHCRRDDGTSWACGRAATGALRKMTAGVRVSCRVRGRDQYGRAVGTCYANGVDLNGRMVRQGHATAYRRYSRRYVGEERSARTTRTGIHSGKYESPREWRRRNN